MKTSIFLILYFFWVSCEKENKVLQDGSYSGSFRYGTVELWESFGIDGDNFIEYASGGVFSQKFPFYCLTKGSYKIHDGTIEFNNIQVDQPPNKELSACDQDFLLMGSYNIEQLDDSIISFWRNSNSGRQEYRLKLYYSR